MMKVTFDFDKRQIVIDGDSQQMVAILVAARELAPALSQIQINTTSSAGNGRGDSKPDSRIVNEPTTGSSSGQTMKQFVKTLQLNNAHEKVTAIAYYAKMFENRHAFSPKEMSDWFGHCGFSKPSQMGVVIWDAKRRHNFLESAGHGQYKLTTNGDNLIIGKINDAEEVA